MQVQCVYIAKQIKKLVNNICEVISIYALSNIFSLWDIIRQVCLYTRFHSLARKYVLLYKYINTFICKKPETIKPVKMYCNRSLKTKLVYHLEKLESKNYWGKIIPKQVKVFLCVVMEEIFFPLVLSLMQENMNRQQKGLEASYRSIGIQQEAMDMYIKDDLNILDHFIMKYIQVSALKNTQASTFQSQIEIITLLQE